MRLKRTLSSQAGFTYVAMLVMVAVIGIMMSQAAISWKSLIQRSKEEELLFRGMQVREALQRYYYGRAIYVKTDLKPADTERANKQPSPKELKDLLEDPNSTEKKRYLRPFALIDPMTNEEWALVRGPGDRIIGVKSTSKLEPIKKANFPYQLEPADFERQPEPTTAVQGATHISDENPSYQDWQFIFDRIPMPKDEGGGQSLPTGDNPPLPTGENPPLPRNPHRTPPPAEEE